MINSAPVKATSCSRSGGSSSKDPRFQDARDVTWSDFLKHMLLTGEVEEIIVHSGVNRSALVSVISLSFCSDAGKLCV